MKSGFLHMRNQSRRSAAHQRLCFRYIDSTIFSFKNRNFRPLTIFCDSTARFVSDLVGNPEDRFSHDEAHIYQDRVHGKYLQNSYFSGEDIYLKVKLHCLQHERTPVFRRKDFNFLVLACKLIA